ncbi:MAG TPA: hypothetical protein ENL43_03920 [candidate division WOR-3 bacterium]|uniref:YvlB/LiaX N-terminal domain-containing protein n=1 Tax=candidate division WOR-3 bacterium TaxID=2052148 RepID=A0A7V5HNJ3_UNCW3|nr:hypothetical protein [candidate division WOR-3 bacterium]
MEERLRILKLLEEGKITAEEAYKLLEALEAKEGETKKEKEEESFNLGEIFKMVGETVKASLSGIPEIIKTSIEAGTSFINAPAVTIDESYTVKPEDMISLTISGAEVEIKEGTVESLKIKAEGVYNFKRKNSEVEVNFSAGEGTIWVPTARNINLKATGSEIKGEISSESISIIAQGAEVELDLNRCNIFNLKAQGAETKLNFGNGELTESNFYIQGSDCVINGIGGDVKIKGEGSDLETELTGRIKDMEIEMKASDVEVKVREDFDGIILLKAKFGNIEKKLDAEMSKEGEYSKIITGEGRSRVKIINDFGDITIL